jgi:hypothetical protein
MEELFALRIGSYRKASGGDAMTVIDIMAAISAKTGCRAFVKATPAGTAVGVPSSVEGVVNWSLVPIDDESRPVFVDFMASINGKIFSEFGVEARSERL